MPKQTIGRAGLFILALLCAVAIGSGLAAQREPMPRPGSSLATPLGDPLQYGWEDENDPYATRISMGDSPLVTFPKWVVATREAARYATRGAIPTDEPPPTPTSRYPIPLSETDALDWFATGRSEELRALMRDPIARRVSAARLREHHFSSGDLAPTELVWLVAAKLKSPHASYPGPSRVIISGVGVHTGAEVGGGLIRPDDGTLQSYAAIEALTNE